ncbi:MAG: pilin [Xanthomonadales bacterium]|nr:pilin [Xanthomonadales bacterium]
MSAVRGKPLLLQFIVTLAAVAVALLAYHYVQRPEIIAMRAQTDALKVQAQTLSDQATALKNQVATEHQRRAEQQQRYQMGAYLLEGFRAVTAAKLAATEYFYTHGKFPASNAQVGIVAPDQFTGRSLRSMALSEGGVITLTFDAKSGVDNGIIKFVPRSANSPQVKWLCTSPDFKEIALSFPQCSYTGGKSQ